MVAFLRNGRPVSSGLDGRIHRNTHLIARQFLIGVVQTAEGLPIDHQVVDGHTAEITTLLPTLSTVLALFPAVRRVVRVADRGLLSLNHLAALQAVRLASGQALEFILAVPGRRYAESASAQSL